MALSEGINGIMAAKDSFVNLGNVVKTNLIAAFSSLKTAIITTGIGALVIAIGLLLPKILEWADYTGRAQRKQDELNASLENHQKALRKDREELQRDLDFKIRLAQAEGKSGSELLKLKESNANKTNAQIYKEIEAARARLKALREVDLGVMASSKEEYNELVKKNIAKRKEVVKEISDLKGEIKAGNQELLIEKTAFETESTKIVENSEKGKTKVVDEEANKRKAKLEQDRIDLINQEQDDIARGILADNAGSLRLRLGGVTKTITESGDYDYVILSTNTDTLKLDSVSSPGFTGKIKSLQVKQENKYLKRGVTYTNGFNFQLEPATWENTFYEYEFNTETITADAAFVAYKTITFDTLDIPESAEYVWEMRLKSMRNEAGTSIISNFTISYLLSSNYLEFLPTGAVSGQSDILTGQRTVA